MDHNCTQKELIEEKFRGVYLHQQAGFDLLNQKLDLVLEQTKKTNGRVTKLEESKWKLTGMAVAISFVITFIFSYLSLKK